MSRHSLLNSVISRLSGLHSLTEPGGRAQQVADDDRLPLTQRALLDIILGQGLANAAYLSGKVERCHNYEELLSARNTVFCSLCAKVGESRAREIFIDRDLAKRRGKLGGRHASNAG